MKPGWTDR